MAPQIQPCHPEPLMELEASESELGAPQRSHLMALPSTDPGLAPGFRLRGKVSARPGY